MDWPFAILNGGLCVLAVVFAAHVTTARRVALPLAVLLFVGWLEYVLAWTPFKPANLFHGLLDSKDLWSIMDGIFGALAITTAYRYWWGWALLLTSLCQEVFHAAYWLRVYDFEAYSSFLDITLLAQIGVFVLIGGRGVRDHFNRGVARLVGGSWDAGAKHARTKWGVGA